MRGADRDTLHGRDERQGEAMTAQQGQARLEAPAPLCAGIGGGETATQHRNDARDAVVDPTEGRGRAELQRPDPGHALEADLEHVALDSAQPARPEARGRAPLQHRPEEPPGRTQASR